MYKNDITNWLTNMQWHYSFIYTPYIRVNESLLNRKAKNLLNNELIDRVFYVALSSKLNLQLQDKKLEFDDKLYLKNRYQYTIGYFMFGGQKNNWSEHKLKRIIKDHSNNSVKEFNMIENRVEACNRASNYMNSKYFKYYNILI